MLTHQAAVRDEKHIHLTMDKELANEVKRRAERLSLSTNELIRVATFNYLNPLALDERK